MRNARRIVRASLFVILATVPASSQATSELHKNVTVGFVAELVAKVNAGSNFSFAIDDDGSDDAYRVIIDVFSYPDRTLLGESFPDRSGEIPHPANVYLPATNHDRAVYVVARPEDSTEALVTLRMTRTVAATPSVWGSRTFPFDVWVPSAARLSIPSGLVTNTHVWTTEENAMTTSIPGTNDTVLFVLHNGAVVAFDDDSGLTRMSWLHLFQPCPAGLGDTCEIVVAQRSNDKSGFSPGAPGYDVPPTDALRRHTTLAWDEDEDNGRDADNDGLGDALEDFLHTDKNKVDTDGDGIPDGIETIGVADNPKNEETTVNLLRFPYYGADPTKPDIFLEVDWTPNCIGGPPDCLDARKNQHQLAVADASRIAALFSNSSIRLHFDNGVTAPGTTTVSGDWGGAEILGDEDMHIDNQWSCKGWTPARKGYFTHALAKDSAQNWGRCTALGNGDPTTNAHELGHYTGLDHWGDKDMKDGQLNCKPHYLSVMNYNYQTQGVGNVGSRDAVTGASWMGPGMPLPAFSTGMYKNFPLNPVGFKEDVGLWDHPPNRDVLDFLNGILHLKVDYATGGVDWNANGVIEPGMVQGMLNFPAWPGADCSPSAPTVRGNYDYFVGLAEPSLDVEGDALYMNAIQSATFGGASHGPAVVVGMKPDLSGCRQMGTGTCATWPTSGALVVTSPEPGPFSPAVAGGIVVYADKDGKLYYFRKPSPNTAGSSVTAVGGPPISSHPVAIQRPSGLISVYAPSGGYLRRWDYDPSLGAWTTRGVTEYWAPVAGADPQPIQTLAGIGLTWGYQLGLNGESQPSTAGLYAAILTSVGSGAPPIVLARLDAREFNVNVRGLHLDLLLQSQWVPLSNAAAQIPADPSNVITSRIGLAFRPDDPNAPEPRPGRFYVTWQITALVGGVCYTGQPIFALSRGNYYSDTQAIADRAIVFDRTGTLGNSWTSWASGASLVYYQGNVRGVYQTVPAFTYPSAGTPLSCATPPNFPDPLSNPKSSFFPNIDGIFNFDEYDHDDVSYMKNHLKWALGQKGEGL